MALRKKSLSTLTLEFCVVFEIMFQRKLSDLNTQTKVKMFFAFLFSNGKNFSFRFSTKPERNLERNLRSPLRFQCCLLPSSASQRK